jgi:SAM-dependent methyltransferase
VIPRSDTLPAWTDHDHHSKVQPLRETSAGQVEPYLQSFLDQESRRLHRRRQQVRVLDFGCGRGDRVAWLCEQGWDAWGVDIAERYLAQGRSHFEQHGFGPDRTRLIEDGRQLPFEEASFDLVLSDHVIEHVEDLDECVDGLRRVLRPGASGLHVYPPRWHPVEPHMHTPLTHWIPKGVSRRAAIHASLRMGLGVNYFEDLPLDERTDIFARYSDNETFYRSESSLRRTFGRYGMSCDFRSPSEAKLRIRRTWIPGPLLPAAAVLYRTFVSTYLHTRLDPGT